MPSDKPNDPCLEGDANVVLKEGENTGISCEVVNKNGHISNGNPIYVNTSIPALLALDPVYQQAAITQELTLPLSEVPNCTGYHGFSPDPLMVADQYK